jgi:hypothetical protein
MMRILGLAITSLLLAQSTADAKIILITRGDTISHIGSIAPAQKLPDRTPPGMPGNLSVGYKWSYFGLFWMDIWTWGGEYCLYEGKNFAPLTPEQAATLMGTTPDQLSRPFWYRFPLMLFLLGLGLALFLLMAILGGISEGRSKKRYDELMQEPAYADALKMATKKLPRDPEAPPEFSDSSDLTPEQAQHARDCFDRGVDHLVKSGIDENVARSNLRLLVDVKTARRRAREAEQQSE